MGSVSNSIEQEVAEKPLSPEQPKDDFTQSFDAREWAKAFVEKARANPAIATDEGTMVGWFANALERGFTEGQKQDTP